MKLLIHSCIILALATPIGLAQVNPGNPEDNGLIPMTVTFDVNTNQNNTATESTGVGIAANGNVIIGWEDDSTDDAFITYYGAVWTLYDTNVNIVTTLATMTNVPGPAPYDVPQSLDTTYRAYFRSDGTPVAGNTGWGPKIKANPFGDGVGMGSSAYFLGREVPELAAINVDAGGGDDFPAVQLANNDGTPVGIVSVSDADAEPAGGIRIGDWHYLANGNIVIVGESRQDSDLVDKFGGSTPNRHVAYKVVTPAGVEVKGWSLVSASNEDRAEMWHGVGVTANGFAVRFSVVGGAGSPLGPTIRMFDNAGNPTTGNIHLETLTGAPHNGGRGDGAGFHGNGVDAYVNVERTTGNVPYVTVLNANGTLRWSREVAEDFETINADRVDGAISPDGRVIAVFDENDTAGIRLPQARLFSANGAPYGTRFWVSERDQPAPGGSATSESRRPRAAWRGGSIAIIWESLNSPTTFNRVVSGRLFDVAVVAPPIMASIANAGTDVTISWSGGGPTYSVIKRSPLNGAPQTLATGLTTTSYTTPKTEGEAYYQITSP